MNLCGTKRTPTKGQQRVERKSGSQLQLIPTYAWGKRALPSFSLTFSIGCFSIYFDKKQHKERKVHFGSQLKGVIHYDGEAMLDVRQVVTLQSQSGSSGWWTLTPQLTFSLVFSPGLQPVAWRRPHLGWLSPHHPNLENPSQACSEVCLRGKCRPLI